MTGSPVAAHVALKPVEVAAAHAGLKRKEAEVVVVERAAATAAPVAVAHVA